MSIKNKADRGQIFPQISSFAILTGIDKEDTVGQPAFHFLISCSYCAIKADTLVYPRKQCEEIELVALHILVLLRVLNGDGVRGGVLFMLVRCIFKEDFRFVVKNLM